MSVVYNNIVLLEHLRQKLIPMLQLGQLLRKLLPLLPCQFHCLVLRLHKELIGLYQLINLVCCLSHPLRLFAIGILRVLLICNLPQLPDSLLKLHHTLVGCPAGPLSVVKLLLQDFVVLFLSAQVFQNSIDF